MENIIVCSFCSMGEEYREVIVKGPDTAICNVCTETIYAIVKEKMKQKESIK